MNVLGVRCLGLKMSCHMATVVALSWASASQAAIAGENSPTTVQAKVEYIIDGATFLATIEGKLQRVKLLGVKCPSWNVAKSKAFSSKLIAKKTVALELSGDRDQRSDAEGILVGRVVLPGEQKAYLGERLLKAGLAKPVKPDGPAMPGLEKLPSSASPRFKVVKTEDVSFLGVVRLSMRVQVDGKVSRDQIRSICMELIEKEKSRKPHNAIGFFLYLPGTNSNGFYTAGKADWAPNGKWEEAKSVKTGDYSKHRLVIETGSAVGEVPKSVVQAEIPEAKRRKIFYELVAAQDRGVGDQKAYVIVAKRHRVDVSVVRKIAVEGGMKGWPMPPVAK